MKTIIAGSRTISWTVEQIEAHVWRSGFKVTEVICGEAAGMDTSGKQWAEAKGIPVKSFPAKWGKYGKGAGHVRNEEMAQYADAAIVITTGSRGAANMINTMRRHRKPCYVFAFRPLAPLGESNKNGEKE